MWELIVILLLMVWSIVCLVFTLVRMKKGIAKRDANMLGILAILWAVSTVFQAEVFLRGWRIFMALFLFLCSMFIYLVAREKKIFQQEMSEEVRKAKEEANEIVETLK